MFVSTGMKSILLNILLLCCICSVSQNKKLDSLLAINDNYKKEDSTKVEHLIMLMRYYNHVNNMEQLKLYTDKAVAVAQKLPNSASLGHIYYMLSHSYHGKKKFLEAIDAYDKYLAIYEKRKDTGRLAGAYMSLSDLYSIIPDYTKALEAGNKAVSLYNAIGDTSEIYGVYMNIGNIYNKLQKPVKALDYIQKALADFEKEYIDTAENYGIYEAHSGIAESYLMATNADLAAMGIKPSEKYQLILGHLFRALKEEEKGEAYLSQAGTVDTKIGRVYEAMGNHPLVLQHFEKALEEINKMRDNKKELADVKLQLGNFYLNKGDFTNGKMYLTQSLQVSKETGLFDYQRDALEKLSLLFEKTHQYDSAYIFYKQYTAARDTIFNQEKEKEITRKQLQIDFAVKENEFRLTQQIADGKLKQQEVQLGADKKIKWLLIAGILLTLVFAGFIFYNQRKTKKLNSTINEQRASLEQLGHVKDKLFSVVSHDMRAPVNSLISFIDILDNGNIPPEKLSLYANDLKQNLSYTSALMNNLLNWAGSQMQGFKPVKEKFDVSAKVDAMANTLQHHLQQKKVSLKNKIPVNTIINADRNMAAAILRNLISNAIKYSYKEGVIEVSVINTAADCTIIVKDEGTGMDTAQTAAFNSSNINQTESTRGTDNEKGTGLGLLLCKTFAGQMGGKITAVNDEKGMIFKFCLPVN